MACTAFFFRLETFDRLIIGSAQSLLINFSGQHLDQIAGPQRAGALISHAALEALALVEPCSLTGPSQQMQVDERIDDHRAALIGGHALKLLGKILTGECSLFFGDLMAIDGGEHRVRLEGVLRQRGPRQGQHGKTGDGQTGKKMIHTIGP